MKYKRIPTDLFIKNRSKLNELLLPGSSLVLQSNDEMHRNGDQNFRFRQSSDFLYLTGIDQEKSILVMNPKHPEEKFREVLFIMNASPEQVTWNGFRLSREEASEISGIRNVQWLEDFERVLPEILYRSQNIYLNVPEHIKYKAEIETRDSRMAKKIQAVFPLHSYHRLAPVLSKLRMIKEPEEIALMQQAVNITRDAFLGLLKFVKPGVMEYEVEAEITREFIRNGANGHAYEPIIASGANACILHYIENNRVCKEGDLLLMDFGAEYANYAADLTRTIPVSGKFSARQAKVYDANLRVLKAAIKLMKPGILLGDFHSEVCSLWEEEHIKLGLYSKADVLAHTTTPALWFKYYMHGTSHSIGLDVHDTFDKAEKFRPGMVFSCEPAIYINGEGIGIRLENDILITESGNIDLCKDIPIEREEIEDLMNYKKS
ncbi:MAG: aminopeptidase P N-terminal domain-containing protein [Bacteroidales bacterium]|nr:aminopeptidase P N-terminal domain-containing protein [Bacteroidales bacterium]MCB8998750.1 aminopeptidase P N-terminal domain-containing protein [Bacteroidales bacterium]